MQKLPHRFQNTDLLQQALRHRSAGGAHNERLEFLGDSLLNCIIAMELYQRFDRVDEGALTRARAELVRESALAEVGRDLQIGDALKFGTGEARSGGHRRASIIADAVEALIAAVFLDSDFVTCKAFVLDLWKTQLEQLPPPAKIEKDAKTRLQELLQSRGMLLPEYELTGETGPDHARIFSIACHVGVLDVHTSGEGSSRRNAEQVAADLALTRVLERL